VIWENLLLLFFLLILSAICVATIESTDSINLVSCQAEFDSLKSHFYTSSTHEHPIVQQGMIRIIGNLTYWDYADRQRPLVWARVWVCDREPDGLDYILVERFTNLTGQFDSGWIVNDYGPGEDGLDLVFWFVASNDEVRIIDPNGFLYYAIDGPYDNVSDGQYSYEAEMPRGHGVWMIFSYHNGITAGWNYLHIQTGYDTPLVTCRWPYEAWPHYHPGGEIHLPNWACWWPDIILHEYGHHVMYSLYGYIPPSMEEHSMNLRSNSTTAWAEGWANFYPLVVFNDSVFTWSNGTHYANINLETLHWCSSGWDDGDEVEGRVAGALWDIYDTHNDGYDVLSDGFSRIWEITRDHHPDTFKEFWDAWNATYYTHPKTPSSPYDLTDWTNTLMAIFQNSIDYRGPGDVDANGITDMNDVDAVIDHFGYEKQNPTPPWDQRMDMDYNDIIDMKDIGFVVKNLWNTYDC
jgi:hypothetical protein